MKADGHNRLVPIFLTMVLLPAATASGLDQVELNVNRALWESHNIADYDFVLSRGCFCEPGYGLPGLVSVRMGSIVSVVDAASGQPRNVNEFYTIDSFFESLQQGLISDPGENTARFDPRYGYPVMVRFDDPLLFDDDITYGISQFTVVPEPVSAMMLVLLLTLPNSVRRVRLR